MKTDITIPITSIEQAENYLKSLIANDECYHPEDEAADVAWTTCNTPTNSECELLDLRMEEVYNFIADPCEFIINNTVQ